MALRFVNADRDSPLLLPPDLREWVSADHIVHFIADAVDLLDLSTAKVNTRGTGSAQYPPRLMIGLLLYCYATGTFSSRRIETLTYENVAVRYLCCDLHPDHDSICKFRRENDLLIEQAFHRILHCAVLSKVLRVGDITLSVDGTRVCANASKHHAVSHGHASSQLLLLEEQIRELMDKAEAADSAPLQDGLSVPQEIKHRRDRIEKLKQAIAVIDERAAARHAREMEQYERKRAAFEQRQKEQDAKKKAAKNKTTKKKKSQGKGKGNGNKAPVPPEPGARAGDQYNFTDPESRIMKTRQGFQQAYNAQAAVEVESRLITSNHVTTSGTDHDQLSKVLEKASPVIGRVATVLVDSGYYSEAMVKQVESGGEGSPQVLAATVRQRHQRTVADLERHPDLAEPPAGSKAIDIMKWRLSTAAGRAKYRLRKQTVEPVFGIIKETLGFRRFHLRGLKKVNLEWNLMALAYNLKRLYHMKAKLAGC